MLPVVALLAASAAASAAARLSAQPMALVRASPWVLFGLAWAGVAWSCQIASGAIFACGPGCDMDELDYGNHFQVYPLIGDYLKEHSPPAATVAVFGSEPELLFYAHRRPATGYIYMYDLVQEQPFRARMEQDMYSEVEKAAPDFLVIVDLWYSWVPFPYEHFVAIQQWLLHYTRSYYEPFGVVTAPPSMFIWGPDCLQHIRPDHRFVVIFQRKHTGSAALPKSAP
jgi:hypothetical protein